MEILGVIGSICFAFCLLPQVIKAYREKSADGLSWVFLLLSAAGNIASASYVLYTNLLSGVFQVPLYFNYGIALLLCFALIWAKIFFTNQLKKITSFEIKDPEDVAELEKVIGTFIEGPCRIKIHEE